MLSVRASPAPLAASSRLSVACFDNLETLKARGKAMVYTTHYMEEAERLCDRIVIIDHGKVIANDTLAG